MKQKTHLHVSKIQKVINNTQKIYLTLSIQFLFY